MDDLSWFVAHTKPRCEKKVAAFCERHQMPVTLPCYDSTHKYRGKTVTFRKPLFPGYVFLQILPEQVSTVRQNDNVANLLSVFDQVTFQQQLANILLALETSQGVRLAPTIGQGMRVKIRQGPLQGIEGTVEERFGMTTVLLRLDFISQAAAIQLEADMLELV